MERVLLSSQCSDIQQLLPLHGSRSIAMCCSLSPV